MSDDECWCGAAAWIRRGGEPVARFHSRHRNGHQNHGITKPCEESKMLFNERKAELREGSPDRRVTGKWLEDVPLDALCHECGITPVDTIGAKWRRRHNRLETEPCVWSREAISRYNAENTKKKKPGSWTSKKHIRKDVGGEHDTLTHAEYMELRRR